ncbi:MAG: hypothetical protein MI806_08505 [Minwuiales bacterium]|nr:hypothetical protein [Minwuiales bacterium]
MVDLVGGNTPSNVQQQQGVENRTAIDGGAEPIQTGKGIVGGGLIIETSHNPSVVAAAGVTHDIDVPPGPDANPNMPTPMDSMDDPSWQPSRDIMAALQEAISHTHKELNKLDVDANTDAVQNLKEYIDSMNQQAADTKELAEHQAIAQTVAGFVGIAGGVGAIGTSGNLALSQGVGSVGGGASSLSTAIEGAADAGLKGDLKTDEKDTTVAQDEKGGSRDLWQKFNESLNNEARAESEITQMKGEMASMTSSALSKGV